MVGFFTRCLCTAAFGFMAAAGAGSAAAQTLMPVGSSNFSADCIAGNFAVVGGWQGDPNGATAAVRWTASGGLEVLGTMAGGTTAAVTAVSADGATMAGTGSIPSSSNR